MYKLYWSKNSKKAKINITFTLTKPIQNKTGNIEIHCPLSKKKIIIKLVFNNKEVNIQEIIANWRKKIWSINKLNFKEDRPVLKFNWLCIFVSLYKVACNVCLPVFGHYPLWRYCYVYTTPCGDTVMWYYCTTTLPARDIGNGQVNLQLCWNKHQHWPQLLSLGGYK